jgi:hypothetical protein
MKHFSQHPLRATNDRASAHRINAVRYLADELRRLPTSPTYRLTELRPSSIYMAQPWAAGQRAASLDAAVWRGDNRAVRPDSYPKNDASTLAARVKTRVYQQDW